MYFALSTAFAPDMKLVTIKAVRTATGIGLKEAKDLIEAAMASDYATLPDGVIGPADGHVYADVNGLRTHVGTIMADAPAGRVLSVKTQQFSAPTSIGAGRIVLPSEDGPVMLLVADIVSVHPYSTVSCRVIFRGLDGKEQVLCTASSVCVVALLKDLW